MNLQILKNYCLKSLHKIDQITAQILIWLIIHSRPLFGPSKVCPFAIGCTEFAIVQLEEHWTGLAMVKITIRLLQCNPVAFWCKDKIHFVYKVHIDRARS